MRFVRREEEWQRDGEGEGEKTWRGRIDHVGRVEELKENGAQAWKKGEERKLEENEPQAELESQKNSLNELNHFPPLDL